MALAFLRRAVPAVATAALVALPVAGCGSSTTSSGGGRGFDPATAVPASVPLYAEARVEPDSDAWQALNAAVRRLGGKDAETALVRQVGKALGHQGLSYAKDVEPWLGTRIGVAATRLATDRDGDALFVLAARDDARAQAFVDRVSTTQREYRGVTYRVTGEDDAAALHEHAVLLGDEAGVKSAIDALAGQSLADAGAFKDAREEVDEDDLGWLYVDPTRALAGAGGQQGALLHGLLGSSGLRSIAAGLRVTDNALAVHGTVLGVEHEGGGDPAAAPGAAPAGSWLAVGIGDVGGTLRQALGQLGGGAGADPQALLGVLGLDLERDLLPWMGTATLSVRGTGLADLSGALVVASKDPAASRQAIGKLRAALERAGQKTAAAPGAPAGAEAFHLDLGLLPGGLDVAAVGDRFVVAFGPDALRDALATGGPRLGDSDAYKTAAGLLDDTEPMAFVDLPRILGLLGGDTPAALGHLGPAVAGVDGDDDATRFELAIGLR